MNCSTCENIKSRKHLIYEDDATAALLVERPAVPGHIIIVPKAHQVIVENVPDALMGHLFLLANKISSACFEVFHAQGTNIIVKNGIAAGQKTTHVQIEILPRFENDGIDMQWKPTKVSDDDLASIQTMLIKELDTMQNENVKKEIIKEEPKEIKEEIPESENYLLKQLDRMP